ncbi:MAG: hypothetical protein HOP12_01165 [Candidatus Eisenbacteria bacterium]|uniref:DUF3368 domain-containing protein n=1 Tax=Eiseniibacteriota bacterium TaxID=2212470 RepID=A0A849SIP1_UNCEI|nr:hypothetical protein [Candidatus Eisenbacteria bacterium]
MNEQPGTPTDSSSLIYLAKVDGLAYAHACLGVLLIPPTVWREVVLRGEERAAPELKAIRIAVESRQVVALGLEKPDLLQAEKLRQAHRLDAGECEVLVLGASRSLVLMDELRATKAGISMGLRVIPALILPALALQAGVLDEPQALASLQRLARVSTARADDVNKIESLIREGTS